MERQGWNVFSPPATSLVWDESSTTITALEVQRLKLDNSIVIVHTQIDPSNWDTLDADQGVRDYVLLVRLFYTFRHSSGVECSSQIWSRLHDLLGIYSQPPHSSRATGLQISPIWQDGTLTHYELRCSVHSGYAIELTQKLDRQNRNGPVQAFICFRRDEKRWTMFQNILRSTRHLAEHPYWLSLACATYLCGASSSATAYVSGILYDTQKQTARWETTNPNFMREKGNFDAVSNQVFIAAQEILLVPMYSSICNQILSAYETHKDLFGRSPHIRNEDGVAIAEIVRSLRMHVDKHQISSEYNRACAESELTHLIHVLNRDDTRINIELAKDSRVLAVGSKRDSSSMKTLAAVTVIFLPATYIATLFAMNMFQWQPDDGTASGGATVSNKFWIYWAITIPLTILTVGAWLFWTRYYHRHEVAMDKRALNNLEAGLEQSTKGILAISSNEPNLQHSSGLTTNLLKPLLARMNFAATRSPAAAKSRTGYTTWRTRNANPRASRPPSAYYMFNTRRG